MTTRCMPSASGCVVVDGVAYTHGALRALIQEREQHALANGGCVPKPAYDELGEERQRLLLEVQQLKARLDRADRLLRLRTSALTRLIARKGPHYEPVEQRRGW